MRFAFSSRLWALLALLTAAFAALPAFAQSDAGMTCNIVGENEQRTGETPVDFYRRIERKRDHWRRRYDETHASYRAIVDSPFANWPGWPGEAARVREVRNTFGFYRDNCEEKLEDIATRSAVTFWTEFMADSGVRQESVTLKEILSMPNCGDIGFVRGNEAFRNEEAFERWARDHGGSFTDRAVYASSKDPHIRACIARLGNGASVRVPTHEAHSACEERFGPDVDSVSAAGYRLAVRDGAIEVEHRISFNYKGSAKNRDALFARLDGARRCIERFYSSQGLRLRLKFHTDPGRREFFEQSDALVELHDDTKRTFSDEWHLSPDPDVMSDTRLCGLAAHEIGHGLGLPDLYPEEDRCPDRRVGDDWHNLMYWGDSFMDSARLSREQVRQIAAPLCGSP